VKAYAISALMKIYAFEVAARRKVDILPEVCVDRLGSKIRIFSSSRACCDSNDK